MRAVALTLALAVLLSGPTSGQEHTVLHVAVREAVDDHAVRLVRRAVRSLDGERAAAFVIELDAIGGTHEAAEALTASMVGAGVSVYALVNAVAAGPALTVLRAADSAFVTPGSRITIDPGEAPVALVDSVADLDDLLERVRLANARVVRVDHRWLGATIEVANRNWNSVHVYVTRSGQRYSLGVATSMREVSFEIGEHLASGVRIRLQAHVIGTSESVATEEITTEPGLVIQWNIENVLSQSNYFVWVR